MALWVQVRAPIARLLGAVSLRRPSTPKALSRPTGGPSAPLAPSVSLGYTLPIRRGEANNLSH
jgi:hypothetical protein